ncbi:hypothetical protein DKX38_029836 [Salix brachista]|uniref:Uncharacterized protein n=1 Tax=Salix brachista TaxID=2182728 RepID=A0A5N5J062_9ROSI|nr:hypothetical protein DKX38_029836 [Salix brachista]
MPYIRRVPQVARTRRQRVTLAAYWVELNNLAMTPDQDIVTHVIRVHDLIQQIVFADASFTQYCNHDYMRMTLRRTLLPRDQQLLDEIAREIGRIASVDAIDWWRVEGAFPRRVRCIF